MQPVEALGHRVPHVAQIAGQHRHAQRVGLGGHQRKALVAQAGGHHRPAFRHGVVQPRPGQTSHKLHLRGGVVSGPALQRAAARHHQPGRVIAQQLPGLQHGAQALQLLQPPGVEQLVFHRNLPRVGNGHRVGLHKQAVFVKGGAQPVEFHQLAAVKFGGREKGHAPEGPRRPVQAVHRRHQRAQGLAVPVAGVAHRACRPLPGAVLAHLTLPQQHPVGAEQPEIVQRLHHRHPGGLGGAQHGGAEPQQRVVDMDKVDVPLPDEPPHLRGCRRIVQRRQRQQRPGHAGHIVGAFQHRHGMTVALQHTALVLKHRVLAARQPVMAVYQQNVHPQRPPFAY